jgi:trk system potassium uptake protein TrkH
MHVSGIALTFVAVGMALCTIVEAASTNRDTSALVVSTLVCGGLGASMWWFTVPGKVRARDVFSAVGWTWVSMTLVGALPFLIAGTFATPGVDLVEQMVNSVFEAASGFSCTGSTVLVDFDRPGRGLLMYRQATQWYGGMGIVVLAVAVLPFLGVGGLDLISAEAPGPSSDRLTPRVSETAKRLWLIYIGFTALIALSLYVVPGPSLYDGVSPYGASIGHFDSVAVEIALIVGMILGGANFTLHWRACTGEPGVHLRDSEFRSYMFVLALAAFVVVGLLWIDGGFGLGTAARSGVFNAVSLGTSSGFGNATGPGTAGDFVLWVGGAQLVLLFLMVVGACTGSTSGGIKIMRMQVLGLIAVRSVRRSQQPRAVIPVKLGRVAVAENIVSRMAGFFLIYLVLVLGGVIVVTALGSELETTLGAVVGSLGNMGPALNEAGPTASFADAFDQPARLVLAALMLIGRLEIFPMVLMFAAPYRLARELVNR